MIGQDEFEQIPTSPNLMMWVSVQTHFDLSFDDCWIRNTKRHSKVKILFEANKALLRMKSEKCFISSLMLGDSLILRIIRYSNPIDIHSEVVFCCLCERHSKQNGSNMMVTKTSGSCLQGNLWVQKLLKCWMLGFWWQQWLRKCFNCPSYHKSY